MTAQQITKVHGSPGESLGEHEGGGGGRDPFGVLTQRTDTVRLGPMNLLLGCYLGAWGGYSNWAFGFCLCINFKRMKIGGFGAPSRRRARYGGYVCACVCL